MPKKFDYMIFIGRMNPPHAAHIKIVTDALTQAERVLILIGSSDQPRTVKNPFSWKEREMMIRASFPERIQDRIIVSGIRDYIYNDNKWVAQVQEIVDRTIESCDRWNKTAKKKKKKSIGLIGHEKDNSSYYLKLFPQWKFISISNIDDIHSSEIRNCIFDDDKKLLDVKEHLPQELYNYLNEFQHSNVSQELAEEFKFLYFYKKAWEAAPYAPIFVTADALVVQSGHVLVIRRRANLGKGLLALPGGFVNQNEFIEDGMLRELREETKLKVPLPVLRGNIKKFKVFDSPKRSQRGRTVTHAYYIELPPGELPKVKGSDDAEKAFWMPINKALRSNELFFEDHLEIISYFVE